MRPKFYIDAFSASHVEVSDRQLVTKSNEDEWIWEFTETSLFNCQKREYGLFELSYWFNREFDINDSDSEAIFHVTLQVIEKFRDDLYTLRKTPNEMSTIGNFTGIENDKHVRVCLSDFYHAVPNLITFCDRFENLSNHQTKQGRLIGYVRF